MGSACAGSGGGTPGNIISGPPPLPPLSPTAFFASALDIDNEALSFQTSTGSDAEWFSQDIESNDGTDALQSGLLEDDQVSCFEAILRAPGAVNFKWKVSSESGRDFVRFYINGEPKEESSGDADWTAVDHILTNSGDTNIRWCYEKDNSGADNMDTAWIDQLVLIPFDSDYSANVQDALDDLSALFNFAVSLDSNGDWFSQNTESRDGVDALQSAAINDGERSCFESSLNGPQRVLFDWKVSSEDGNDFLKFYVNDVEEESITGNVNWNPIEEILPAAVHYDLKWCYEKDAAGSALQDSSWIDRLRINSFDSGFSANAKNALDNEAYPFVFYTPSGGNAEWFLQDTESADGLDALQSGSIIDGQRSCFETVVQGPAAIAFDWQVSSEENSDFLTFSIDGQYKESISGNLSWRQTYHVINTSSRHKVRWCYEKDVSGTANNNSAWLDQLNISSFNPSASTPLDALDTANTISPSADSDVDWFGQTNESNDGSDALESGDIANGQKSCFETAFSGPLALSFDWKVSSQQGSDHLKFFIDGTELSRISGEVDWETVPYALNASGNHTLKWCYEKDAGTSLGSDRAWLDQLNISSFNPSANTPPDALDTVNTITASGDADWFGQSSLSQDGTDALQSGRIGDSQSSCASTSLSGTADISFYWKVSSQANADHLKFYVNNVEVREISGEIGWTQVQYSLTSSGSHTLRWCYEKDGSNAEGWDTAWLDELSITSTAVLSLQAALDSPSLGSLVSTGDASWFSQTIETNDGSDALESGAIADGEMSCFQTDLSAPRVVRFYWKVDSESGADHLRFYVDNVPSREISGSVNWSLAEHILTGSGTQTLKWCYEKDAALNTASGSDKGWVDQLELITPLDMQSALDNTALSFSSSTSGGNWYGQTLSYYSTGTNNDSLMSNLIGDGESSCFETNVTGPMRVRFHWRVDSESGADHLRFYVDNVPSREISGNVNWTLIEHLHTGSGAQALKWCYEKDAALNTASGLDRGWVDNLELLNIVDGAAALDLTGTSQTIASSVGSDADWYGQTLSYYNTGTNNDSLTNGLIGDGEGSCFETNVTGPMRVRFHWQVDSESGADYLRFYVDNVSTREISGNVNWTLVEHLHTGSGAQALKWCYEKDAALNTASGLDRGWVDNLELLNIVDGAAALELTGTGQTIASSVGSDADWYGQTLSYYNTGTNNDSLTNGLIGDGEGSCFETNVTGPMRVRFHWQVDSESGADHLRFYVDNVPSREISGNVNWTLIEHLHTGSGAQALKWCYEKDAALNTASGQDRGWVDNLELLNIVDGATALDLTGTSQTIASSVGSDADWYGQTLSYYNTGTNNDSLTNGLVGDGEESCFETNVTGPVRVRFHWQVDSESGADHLRFYVDNVPSREISGNVNWTLVEHLHTGSGAQALKWCYEKDVALNTASGLDRGWVDNLELLSTVDAATALDTSQSIASSMGSNANWYGQTSQSNDGVDAVQSGLIGDGEVSCFETDVNGPKRIRFYWQVDSESSADHLRFYVDNVSTREISGNVNWTQIEHLLTGSGSQTLKWCYEKDLAANTANGQDQGWVDQLELLNTISKAAALDVTDPSQTFASSAGSHADWYGQTSQSNDGVDALQSGLIGDGEESCFETSVTGPARVRFHWQVDSESSADYLRFLCG